MERAVEPNTNRAAYRRLAMSKGIPCQPMRQCLRFELGVWSQTRGCNRHDIAQIEKQLKRLDPNLEVLYDKAAVQNSMQPSWHLYRRVRRAGVEGLDTLELVFSIQRDYDQPWPLGTPIHPDSTVLKEYQKRIHRHNHAEGDPFEAALKETKEYNETVKAKTDATQADTIGEISKDANKVIRQGAESDTARKIRHGQMRKATETPKTTSYPGAKAR